MAIEYKLAKDIVSGEQGDYFYPVGAPSPIMIDSLEPGETRSQYIMYNLIAGGGFINMQVRADEKIRIETDPEM